MNKCPACGYEKPTNRNVSLQINKMMSKKSKKTRTNINKVARLIINNVPQDNRFSLEKFLYAIKDTKDSIVDYCINQYYESRAFENGKGFAYLRAIIQNQNRYNHEIVKQERKRLGSVPPIVD